MSWKGLYLICTLFVLSSCFSIGTTSDYNKNWTRAVSTSEPIYLSFKDNKHASYFFTLKHDTNDNTYLLYVYWNAPDNEQLFNGTKSTLKFLIDKEVVITLHPIKIPKTIGYDLETKGHQEHAAFALNYDQLKAIATANNVDVELTGKYIVVNSYFNKIHTFKAFNNFVDQTPR